MSGLAPMTGDLRDEVGRYLRDPGFSRESAAAAEMEILAPGHDLHERVEAVTVFQSMFANIDPPRHTKLRSMAAPAFRPSVIRNLNSMVTDIADTLIRELPVGEVDLKEHFAKPLSQQVICRILGVPVSDYRKFNGQPRPCAV